MIDPINSSSMAGVGSSGRDVLGGLGSEAFLKLLVAQLRYQNPLQPTEGTEFLNQTAQFTTVETLQAIAETQQQLIGMQSVAVALGAVGRDITAVDAAGNEFTGVVDGISFSALGPVLTVGDVEVPLTQIISIGDAD